jgi:hypothetical protein
VGGNKPETTEQSMRSHTIVAEQTSQNRYFQRGSLPPREIELTVRLVIPEEEGTDVGITAELVPDLPAQWEDRLYERLYSGVHNGLASVGSPLPAGGIEVEITRFRVSPQISSESDTEDILRVGDTLEALTAATVGGLWSGLIRLGSLSAA